MGMQHSDGAGSSLKLFVVLRKSPHGLPDALEHQVIEGALMLPCQRPKFLRQGESEQKIRGRHLFLELTFQPLLPLMVLTVRTVTMTTGMGYELLMIALSALRQHLGTGCRAAILHGRERLEMGRENPIGVLLEELSLKGFNNR